MERDRLVLVGALLVVFLAAGCVAPEGPGFSSPDAPPDPDQDVLGWEAGYWHNESLPLTLADGLNASERDAVVARAMARVELLRDMEFDGSVPVAVETRAEFRERYTDGGGGSGPGAILTDQTFEALFLVGEATSGGERESETTAASVVGYYLPSEDRIVLVSDRDAPDVRESVLAHELVHALQFRNFELSYNGSTREAENARNAVLEGEARLIDYRYRQRCGGEWTCVVPPTDGTGGSNDSNAGYHPGIAILNYFPYSDGPIFIRAQYRAGGWDRVRSIHGDLPASTEQVIFPDRYGTEAPTEIRIRDRSSDRWAPVSPDRRPYESVGMPGITAMFAYTSYDEANTSAVVPADAFLTMDPTGLDPINYAIEYAAGWDGDRLKAYRDGDRRGYVWRLAWDNATEADEFATGYRHLLSHWGGERVRSGVWRIETGRFADAFRVTVDGRHVTITNAPSVPALDGVRSPP